MSAAAFLSAANAPGGARAAALPPLTLAALVVSAVGLALALPAGLGLWLDERQLLETSVWAKPLKFIVSMPMLLVTLAWAATLLPAVWQHGRALRLTAAVLGTLTVSELFWFVLQAARARPAHYIEGSSLESIVYHAITGGGATVMMLATSWIGYLVWRHARAQTPPALRLATALGLGLSGALTIATAFPMAMELLGQGHAVGGVASGARALPVLGWSTEVGDLRVPHFFATHLAQALPLLAWLCLRRRARHAKAWVWAGTVTGLAIVAATFLQAALGRPFLALS